MTDSQRPRSLTRLLTVSLVLAIGATAALWWGRRGPGPNPNVVLIVVDTLRADRLPFYESKADTAPFLHRLARRSVVFENVHATSSWTAPSTASIFTSLYPNQHGVWTGLVAKKTFKVDRTNRIPSDAPRISTVLKGLGYRTFGVAENINVGEQLGFTEGFDRFVTHRYLEGATINETVEEWRDEILAGGKYFLYVHYMDPHQPYVRRDQWFRADAADDHLRRLERWGVAHEPDQVGRRLSSYDSEIGYLDSKIAHLFELLDLERDTIVIVTADHGEQFLEHGRWEHHGLFLHQELLRVPLVVYHPERFAARRVEGQASILDVLPTLRALLSSEPAASDMGISLVPAMEDGLVPERTLFAMRMTEGWTKPPPIVRSALTGRWKYVWTRRPKWGTVHDTEELFDTNNDPHEQRNVVQRFPEVASDLRREIESFEETAHVFPRSWAETGGPDPEREEHLRALGYVE